MNWIFCIAILLILASVIAAESPSTAFHNPAYVFVPDKPSEGERAGAQDIVTYLWKAASLQVRLIVGKPSQPVPEDAPRIHVGATPEAKKIIGDMLDEEMLPDAFALKVRGNTLAILGKSDVSTRWGCQEFLERCAGVRWYMPQAFGTHVPKLSSIDVPTFNEVQRPSFRWRVGSALVHPRLRQSTDPSFSKMQQHTFHQIFDPKEYAEEYPDLYSMKRDGTRVKPDPETDPKARQWQVCLLHPKAADIAAGWAHKQFQEGTAAVGIGMNDNRNWCQCEDCKALYAEAKSPEAIGHGDQYARYFLTFANQVARQVRDEFPDRYLGYLGYAGTLGVPENMEIEPSLYPFLVNKSMDLGEQGRDGLVDVERWKAPLMPWPNLQKWQNAINRFGENFASYALYDWYFGRNRKAAPNMSFPAVAHYLRYANARRCNGVYVECYPNWGLDGHKYYFYFKLLWNVDYDWEKELEAFYANFFHKAASQMKKYFELCQDLTFVDGAGLNTISPYTPGKIAELRSYLAEALRLAGDDALVRERIGFFADAIEVTFILGAQWHAAEQAKTLMASEAPLHEVAAALAQASGPAFDLDLYYHWVLNKPEERFLEQFPRPLSRREEPYQDALEAFVEYAKRAAGRTASKKNIPVAEARRLLREEVASKLENPVEAAQVLAQISP